MKVLPHSAKEEVKIKYRYRIFYHGSQRNAIPAFASFRRMRPPLFKKLLGNNAYALFNVVAAFNFINHGYGIVSISDDAFAF